LPRFSRIQAKNVKMYSMYFSNAKTNRIVSKAERMPRYRLQFSLCNIMQQTTCTLYNTPYYVSFIIFCLGTFNSGHLTRDI